MKFAVIYLLTLLLCTPVVAQTVLGTDTLLSANGAKIALFYPVDAATPWQPGPLGVRLAKKAAATNLNKRLIMISHGSGGSPWVHTDLAQALVQRGYVVAFPTHQGDHYEDPSEPGPETWKRRPKETSLAIDAVQAHAFWGANLKLDKVGMYGQSAGGHTALSLAGGVWSTKNFLAHCNRHMAEDFNACVGSFTLLTGSFLDQLKLTIARWTLNARFGSDDAENKYHDSRIAVVVAGNPYAADFDERSLLKLNVPLGLVSTGKDAWLNPKFHSSKVLNICKNCAQLVHWPDAGHGALLSPYPHGESAKIKTLLADSSGFDRAVLAEGDQRIAEFIDQHLRN